MGAEETGFEWVIFAMPLDKNEDESEFTIVQVGGEQARIVGNRGGLDPKDTAVYACRYLWAIQLSDAEPVRFIKVDEEGEEVAWTETLEELLPFALSEDAFAVEDDTDEDDEDDDDDSRNRACTATPCTNCVQARRLSRRYKATPTGHIKPTSR
ncbi:hypothetical protein C660_03513 [Alcaligenes sp. HPC1271]|nr:hypothetical protein C660_03513 [Alcaligenes sp. HPC1271]